MDDYDHYDLSRDAWLAFFTAFKASHPIKAENVAFTPPPDGSPWLQFDYMEASSAVLDLARRCRSYIGMVQIGVHFSPGTGIDKARQIAKEIARFAEDGKIIGRGYIFTPGEVRPLQKQENGWFYPVRFSVRYDTQPQTEIISY